MQSLTLAILALTTVVLAAPVAHKAPAFATPNSNTATCVGYTSSENVTFDSSKVYFHVNVGRPYLGGGRCNELQAKIETKFNIDGKLNCKGGDDDKNTVLKFKGRLNDELRMVNAGLKVAYPEITFSCPTEIGN